MAAGAVTATASGASAYIVCNRAGDCWHSHYRPAYGPGYVNHPDDWYFHRTWDGDRDHHWRQDWHDGRGYLGQRRVGSALTLRLIDRS